MPDHVGCDILPMRTAGFEPANGEPYRLPRPARFPISPRPQQQSVVPAVVTKRASPGPLFCLGRSADPYTLLYTLHLLLLKSPKNQPLLRMLTAIEIAAMSLVQDVAHGTAIHAQCPHEVRRASPRIRVTLEVISYPSKVRLPRRRRRIGLLPVGAARQCGNHFGCQSSVGANKVADLANNSGAALVSGGKLVEGRYWIANFHVPPYDVVPVKSIDRLTVSIMGGACGPVKRKTQRTRNFF